MPFESKKPNPKRVNNGLVQNEITLAADEKYSTDREGYFNGKRVHEMPDENCYSIEQRIENWKN